MVKQRGLDMLRFADPYHLYYSPAVIGCTGILTIYLGLALLAVQGMVAPGWIWLFGLSIPLTGFILQIASRRVVYIRGYQVVVMGLMALVHGSAFWTVVSHNQLGGLKLLAGMITGILLLVLGIGVYRTNWKRSYFAEMPYGPVGVLDSTTGLVDPARSPRHVQDHRGKAEQQYALLWRLAPLTAGLSMLLVRGLPRSSIAALVGVIAFGFAAFGAMGAGGYSFFLVASWRWERAHSKCIYVKRP